MGKDKYRGKIAELINNGPDRLITGGVDDNRIVEVEKELNVTLPESYKWFLREYGHGGIAGIDIIGIGPKSVEPPVVQLTKDYRKIGMPNSLVAIYNADEWVYCLETNKMVNGECPVIDWDFRGESFRHYDNFYLFLIDKLESALDDYEDEIYNNL